MVNTDGKAKITKVTVTNKALASVSLYDDKLGVWFTPKKAGSTTVKVTVKNGSKKKVHTVKLKIYNYENPMTSLKVGKKQYKSKFATKSSYYEKKPKKASTVKVNVKAKKGYEINNISYAYKVNGEYKYKTLTNGQSFKLDKNTQYLAISFRNKKTGCTFSTYLNYFY